MVDEPTRTRSDEAPLPEKKAPEEEAEAPFEVVIEEDVVPIGQIDFKSYLRWKELEAARRLGTPALPSAAGLDVGPSASSLQRSVYSGVVSLLKIAGGLSLLAAGV